MNISVTNYTLSSQLAAGKECWLKKTKADDKERGRSILAFTHYAVNDEVRALKIWFTPI